MLLFWSLVTFSPLTLILTVWFKDPSLFLFISCLWCDEHDVCGFLSFLQFIIKAEVCALLSAPLVLSVTFFHCVLWRLLFCYRAVSSCLQAPPSCLWTRRVVTAVSGLSCCCRRSRRTTRTASASCSTRREAARASRPPRSTSTSKVQILHQCTAVLQTLLRHSNVTVRYKYCIAWVLGQVCGRSSQCLCFLQRTTVLWEFLSLTRQAPPTTSGKGWS